ncbi:hypothetical protein VTJ49DRAFT_2442 [Mycothermus thermophilus]|uniref:Xylanolytic transcriptional activator regulatory domain-containing protein n=1 Tax=Humicola insolens TaxID=85995 RepID=A0ABR3VAB4_HUMIN
MTPTPPSTTGSSNGRSPEPHPDDMQNRIDRLEGLVLSLMHGGANVEAFSFHGAPSTTSSAGAASNPSPSGPEGNALPVKSEGQEEGTGFDGDESDIDEGLANSLGVLKVDADRSKHVYIGEQHWHTILMDIAEVKNYFATHKKDLERSYERIKLKKPTTAKQPPTLLMGATPATEVELRAELPPKSTVIVLCQRYFSSTDNSSVLLHVPTFYRQLEDHWKDPSKTPIMWLALLYSVLSLAMLSYHKIGDEPAEWKGRVLELSNEYRLRTVQCLIAGEYTKPSQYTVEAMVLYAFCEYSARFDADSSIWVIVAMMVRIALRMGYHRDGKWFPNLTPFEAEMRRRTWAIVTMLDTFFSHQVSLPSMISYDECDTDLPHNLYDEDFGPQTKPLPPSRPDTDPTPVSYTVAKVRLCQQLTHILHATGRLKNQAHYDEILRLDAGLREIKSRLPPHLRLQPLEQCQPAPTLWMAQFHLDVLYLKTMCLLHRKYMSRARHNPRYSHSRRSAVEASLEMLRHLATIHRESQPNGRMHSIRWFFCNVATKDFLLPAMLVVLDLHFDNMSQPSHGHQQQDPHAPPFWTREQRQEMVHRLEVTRGIWKGLSDCSIEAVKASNILDIMLAKIKGFVSTERPTRNSDSQDDSVVMASDEQSSASTYSSTMPSGLPSRTATVPGPSSIFDGTQASSSTGYTPLGMSLETPNGGQPGADTVVGGGVAGPDFATPMLGFGGVQTPLNVFDSMAAGNVDFPVNFDWESLENYTQTANWGGESLQFFPASSDFVYDTGTQDGSQYTYGVDLTGTN